MPEIIKVAEKINFESNRPFTAEVSGQKIAIFKINEQYYAISDTCPHRGGPLSEGKLNGTIVTCPWHGAKFDISTGKVQSGPTKSDVPCFRVLVDDSDLKIEFP